MLDETRLQRLIDAYFDQELAGDEKRELECMLLASAKARETFLDQAEWHGLTRELALRNQMEELMGGASAPEPKVRPMNVIPFVRKHWLSAGFAACLALTWGFHFYPFKSASPHAVPVVTQTAAREEVALLVQAVDVKWAEGSQSFAAGSALPKGWLRIERGTLRLDFYSGARVFLEGPASLDLLSQDLARLEKGKLTANVPPPAQGFTILNDNLRVVDRGTEFGMTANGTDDCEVHVFKGEVELQGDIPAAGIPDAKGRSLFQGSAVSIRNGKWEAMSANPNSFADPATIQQAAVRQTEISWNKWLSDSESFHATPGLLVHFDFEDLKPNSQLIANRATGAGDGTNGTVIGCEQTTGRWDRKAALGFAKTSDRVRFRTEGTTTSLTLMAWVRVDSLPEEHNSLLSMAPGQIGEIHWKLDKFGSLLLGIRATHEPTIVAWERLVSPPVVTAKDFGRWMKFTTVIDGEARIMKHYVNDREVASAPIKHSFLINLGMANIGNFDSGLPPEAGNTYVRNFNGRFDEFAMISRALTPEEINRFSAPIAPAFKRDEVPGE